MPGFNFLVSAEPPQAMTEDESRSDLPLMRPQRPGRQLVADVLVASLPLSGVGRRWRVVGGGPWFSAPSDLEEVRPRGGQANELWNKAPYDVRGGELEDPPSSPPVGPATPCPPDGPGP